jgi:hypothetical protein
VDDSGSHHRYDDDSVETSTRTVVCETRSRMVRDIERTDLRDTESGI